MTYFIINQEMNKIHIRYSLLEATKRARELCKEFGGEWIITHGVRTVEIQEGKLKKTSLIKQRKEKLYGHNATS